MWQREPLKKVGESHPLYSREWHVPSARRTKLFDAETSTDLVGREEGGVHAISYTAGVVNVNGRRPSHPDNAGTENVGTSHDRADIASLHQARSAT